MILPSFITARVQRGLYTILGKTSYTLIRPARIVVILKAIRAGVGWVDLACETSLSRKSTKKRSIFSRRQQNSLHVIHFLSPHTRDSLRNRTLWIKGTASSEKEQCKTSPVQIDSAIVCGKFRGTQVNQGNNKN